MPALKSKKPHDYGALHAFFYLLAGLLTKLLCYIEEMLALLSQKVIFQLKLPDPPQ